METVFPWLWNHHYTTFYLLTLLLKSEACLIFYSLMWLFFSFLQDFRIFLFALVFWIFLMICLGMKSLMIHYAVLLQLGSSSDQVLDIFLNYLFDNFISNPLPISLFPFFLGILLFGLRKFALSFSFSYSMYYFSDLCIYLYIFPTP